MQGSSSWPGQPERSAVVGVVEADVDRVEGLVLVEPVAKPDDDGRTSDGAGDSECDVLGVLVPANGGFGLLDHDGLSVLNLLLRHDWFLSVVTGWSL